MRNWVVWRPVVFCTVDYTSLKSRINFAVSHRSSACTKSGNHSHHKLRFLNTNLKTFHIAEFCNRAFWIVEVTGAGIKPRKTDQVVLVHWVKEFFSDWAVKNAPHLSSIFIKIWKLKNIERFFKFTQWRNRNTCKVNSTKLKLFNYSLFITQLSAMININVNSSVCLLFYKFSKFVRSLCCRIILSLVFCITKNHFFGFLFFTSCQSQSSSKQSASCSN